MRTRYAAQLSSVLALIALPGTIAACGDDTSAGSGGSSSESATSTTGAASTSSSATPASSGATTSSDGGGTGEGGAGDGGGVGGAADGGGTGEGGAGDGGATGVGGAENLVFDPIWENIVYPTDGGRVDLEAFIGVSLQIRAAGTDDVVFDLPDQALPAGLIVHAYAIGRIEDESVDTYLIQDDGDFVPPDEGEGNIRLAHFSPDVPAVDVYLTDESFLMYGPLLDTDSFAFPSMSGYGSFPPGTYEATVVVTGGSPFGQAVGVIPGIEIVEGKSETLALVGLAGEGTFDVAAYVDDLDEPADGFGAVTFVNAIPDAPSVDVGALVPAE